MLIGLGAKRLSTDIVPQKCDEIYIHLLYLMYQVFMNEKICFGYNLFQLYLFLKCNF